MELSAKIGYDIYRLIIQFICNEKNKTTYIGVCWHISEKFEQHRDREKMSLNPARAMVFMLRGK